MYSGAYMIHHEPLRRDDRRFETISNCNSDQKK